MTIHCRKCGFENTDDSVYCQRCGSHLPNRSYDQGYVSGAAVDQDTIAVPPTFDGNAADAFRAASSFQFPQAPHAAGKKPDQPSSFDFSRSSAYENAVDPAEGRTGVHNLPMTPADANPYASAPEIAPYASSPSAYSAPQAAPVSGEGIGTSGYGVFDAASSYPKPNGAPAYPYASQAQPAYSFEEDEEEYEGLSPGWRVFAWFASVLVVMLIGGVIWLWSNQPKAAPVSGNLYTIGYVIDEYDAPNGTVQGASLQPGQQIEIIETKNENGTLWGKKSDGTWIVLEAGGKANAVSSQQLDFSLMADGRIYTVMQETDAYPLANDALAPKRKLMSDARVTIKRRGESPDGILWGQLEDGLWVKITDGTTNWLGVSADE